MQNYPAFFVEYSVCVCVCVCLDHTRLSLVGLIRENQLSVERSRDVAPKKSAKKVRPRSVMSARLHVSVHLSQANARHAVVYYYSTESILALYACIHMVDV